jgi:hypothetical protein
MSTGQEREALESLSKNELYRAALAAREEPQPTGEVDEREWMLGPLSDDRDGIREGPALGATELVYVVPKSRLAALMQDTERPGRCWTLVSGGEGELPVVEAGPMLVREEVRVREDTERPDDFLDRLAKLGRVRVFSNPHDVGKWCVEIRDRFYWGDSSREVLGKALAGVRDTGQEHEG